jgi:hypothetical protein
VRGISPAGLWWAPVRVLSATTDNALAVRLSGHDDEGLSLMFAPNAYQTSAMIGTARPDLVIVDEDLCSRGEPRLLDDLIQRAVCRA